MDHSGEITILVIFRTLPNLLEDKIEYTRLVKICQVQSGDILHDFISVRLTVTLRGDVKKKIQYI